MITLRINSPRIPAIFAIASVYAQASYKSEASVVIQRLDSDSVGVAHVTFSGVHADSEIRVFYPNGDPAAGVESCVSNQVLEWPIYAAGNPNNEVTIKIIHTDFKLKEFLYVSQNGVQSLPIQQERDKWYSNPI